MTQRTAIVTGAASGIGRAISLRLARDGWHIALADINPEGSEETARLVSEAGGSAQVEHLDVSSEGDWLELRDRLQSQWTTLDAIVNNAGVVVAGTVHETPVDDWDWLLSINLRGVILGCHTMVPWLIEHPRRSAIVNVSSIAGLVSPAKMGAYNVSKSGVVALSETLDQELRSKNVGVTVVCPWFTQTNLLKGGRFADPNEKHAGSMMMQGSGVTPEMVADRAVRAMYRRKLYAVVGFRAGQCWSMKRHWPHTYAWLAELIQRRFVEPAVERHRRQQEQERARENVTG
jgi:NAD(P)-dependent dehydrogenase (short-subunit alcohol dehydrogenase family)